MNEIFKRQHNNGIVGLPPTGSLLLKSAEMEWGDCDAEGFAIKPLMEDGPMGLRCWLMKVEPGAFSALHAHEEIEQIYVLEGSFYDQDNTYKSGDYVVRAAGAMHSAGSKDGALVMLFYSPAPTP